MTEKAHDLSSRLDVLARWLQQEEDELLYSPDAPCMREDHLPDASLPWNPGWMGYYILDGHSPIAATREEWGVWHAQHDMQVALTFLAPGLVVSTVFLGLDHQRYAGQSPLLFETLILRDGHEVASQLFHTWDEAAQSHDSACAALRMLASETP